MSQSQQKKVLCIEDEHFISELYMRSLNKAGYDTTVVVDGVTGLKEIESDAYDIVLIDLMLPGMTGMEILRTLHDSDKKVRARIIVTTNLDVKEDLRSELEQMADGYIIKAEITPRQLAEILDRIKLD